MVVFCKVSADLAFKSWKASQTSAATKDRFWRELTKACKEITGAELYKPATLDKYVRDETSISDDDAKIIMKAAKVLGVEFRLKNLRPDAAGSGSGAAEPHGNGGQARPS